MARYLRTCRMVVNSLVALSMLLGGMLTPGAAAAPQASSSVTPETYASHLDQGSPASDFSTSSSISASRMGGSLADMRLDDPLAFWPQPIREGGALSRAVEEAAIPNEGEAARARSFTSRALPLSFTSNYGAQLPSPNLAHESLEVLDGTEAIEASGLSDPSSPSVITSPDPSQTAQTTSQFSLTFIENVGQFDPKARFSVRGSIGTLYLAEDALWFTVLERLPMDELGAWDRGLEPADHVDQPRRGVNLKLSFPGASPHPRLEPFNRLDTKVSYFIGNDLANWHPDVPVWGGVRYVDLYPGVDLEITSQNGQLVQRLAVRDMPDSLAPSPDRSWGRGVRLRVEGVDALTLDHNALRLVTAVGDFRLPLLQAVAADGSPLNLPTAPPEVDGHEISAPFAPASATYLLPTPAPVRSAGLASPFLLGMTSPLQQGVSDFIYSTFVGGNLNDAGDGIAVDGSGNAYVTGLTRSDDFPTTPGAFDTNFVFMDLDAFVVKLNADGTGLDYATYLGGSSSDYGYDITVDGTGNAYVTGETDSSNFPTGSGFDTGYNGGWDAFVVKLNASGTVLVHAGLSKPVV
jgi:hypothetical protein